MKNLLFVLLFLIVSACNSCQKSTALIESAKVENSKVIFIQGTDYDVSNVIFDENYPVEKCGKLNPDGNIYVRDIIIYSPAAKDSSFFDRNGILQVKGDAIDFTIIK